MSARRLRNAVLAAGVALALATAAHAEPAAVPPRAAEFLGRLEKAWSGEDLPGVLALHAWTLRDAARDVAETLFRERNYFTLSHEVVAAKPREDGTLLVEVVSTLRSRRVDEPFDRVEKARWIYILSGSGELLALEAGAAPRRQLPADSPWRPEELVARVDLMPRPGRLGTPEGAADVRVRLRVRNAGAGPAVGLAFALHPHVRQLVVGGGAPAPERAQDAMDTWWMTLSEPVPPGGTTTLELTYSLEQIGPTDVVEIGQEGGHLFWESGWLPWLPPPPGEPPPRLSHDLTVTLPRDLLAAAPGVLAEEQDLPEGRRLQRWFSRFPGEQPCVVFGRFTREEVRLSDRVALDLYRTDGAAGLRSPRLRTALASMVSLGEDVIGPSPVERVTVAELRAPVLRSAPGFFAVQDFSLDGRAPPDRRAALKERKRREDTLLFLAHHVGHLWFVDTVEADGLGAPVLTEGLSDHFAAEWMRRDGQAQRAATLRRGLVEAAAAHPELDRALAQAALPHPDSALYVNAKAQVVLDGYRALVGEERWRSGLARYWQENRGRRATLASLAAALSGGDSALEEYFAAWLQTAGFANPTVRGVRAGVGSEGAVVVLANDGVGPVPVRVVTSQLGAQAVHDVVLGAGEEKSLVLEGSAAPSQVVLDPDAVTWQSNVRDDTWPRPARSRDADLAKEDRPDWE